MSCPRASFVCTTLAISATLLVVAGCGGPGVVSPAAYEYSKALYAITNRKAEPLLIGVSEQIAADLEAEKLSAAEAKMLSDIVEQAQNGDWEDANRESRAIMEAQVERQG